MTIKYKNENNIYAWRNSEGYWLFSKESDVNTNNYILKSTTNNSIPYSHDVKYVTKQNIEVTVNISINNSTEEPEVDPTKGILVAAGFDETGFLSGTNGEYELLDASATGTAREWHCSTNNMRIVWYSSGSYWCIAGKDNMYCEVYTDENVTDPWDTTWYFGGSAISGATVTKKANADGGNGGSSDITANGFKVTGVTSPASLNGVYSLTSGDISDLSSCQWTNENGGHLKYFSGGYWIFGDTTSPANTPDDCFYWSQCGIDGKKPWEITSWSDGQYSHSGTLVLTVGGSSGGSGTPLFNVYGLTTTSANGDYWLTNEGATGYDRVFTNGVAYCIGHTEMYDPSVPEAGYQIVQWMICEGDSYANRGTIYAISGAHESLTADPWDCYFLDDKTGSGITITKIESESGGGGSSDTEEPTPDEPEITPDDYADLIDDSTEFLLYKGLTDVSGKDITVENNGLTAKSDGIYLSKECYAVIPANALPATVFTDNTSWSIEIKFRCTDVDAFYSATSANSAVCLFGNSSCDERFDMLATNDGRILIGTFDDSAFGWSIDTEWHTWKITHSSDNVFTHYFDETQKSSQTKIDRDIRINPLYIGWEGDLSSNTRYGYPFVIEYIKIASTDGATSEEPEEPEASFGTYLQISGSAAENDGLNGIYKLNESTATDIHKEWININDDTKKVVGSFVDIDPATYWTVYGGSDNYYHDNWESSMSYPWNADNSSFVWYYHMDAVDFHVTPYESAEELSTPDTPSEPVEPTVNIAFTVSGCSYEDLNGDWIEESANVYVKADDSTKKCTMDYGPGFWRFLSSSTGTTLVNTSDTKDNPWEVEWWYDTVGDTDESSMTVTKE